MASSSRNSVVGEKAELTTVDGYKADGVLGSGVAPGDGQPVALTRTGSVRKRRKAKTAKLNTDNGATGAGQRRASSARATRSASLRRTGSGRYNSKKLSKRKKVGGKSTPTDVETTEYKRDFDEAIAKLTNHNLISKAIQPSSDSSDTVKKSSTTRLQENGAKKYGPTRRARSAQNVVGPRPHSTMGNGASGVKINTIGLNKQTLSVGNTPTPLIVKDSGIGFNKPFSDAKPSTVSGYSGRTTTAIGSGVPEVKRVRPISANTGVSTTEKSNAIQSRLRTYFSGVPYKSSMATTFKTPIVDTYNSEKKGIVNMNGNSIQPPVSKSYGSGTASNGHTAGAEGRLRTTTSIITLQPINGLIGGSESHSISDGARNHSFGVKTNRASSAITLAKPGYDASQSTAPRPILKSADVRKSRKKRNVRFTLPEDEEET